METEKVVKCQQCEKTYPSKEKPGYFHFITSWMQDGVKQEERYSTFCKTCSGRINSIGCCKKGCTITAEFEEELKLKFGFDLKSYDGKAADLVCKECRRVEKEQHEREEEERKKRERASKPIAYAEMNYAEVLTNDFVDGIVDKHCGDDPLDPNPNFTKIAIDLLKHAHSMEDGRLNVFLERGVREFDLALVTFDENGVPSEPLPATLHLLGRERFVLEILKAIRGAIVRRFGSDEELRKKLEKEAEEELRKTDWMSQTLFGFGKRYAEKMEAEIEQDKQKKDKKTGAGGQKDNQKKAKPEEEEEPVVVQEKKRTPGRPRKKDGPDAKDIKNKTPTPTKGAKRGRKAGGGDVEEEPEGRGEEEEEGNEPKSVTPQKNTPQKKTATERKDDFNKKCNELLDLVKNGKITPVRDITADERPKISKDESFRKANLLYYLRKEKYGVGLSRKHKSESPSFALYHKGTHGYISKMKSAPLIEVGELYNLLVQKMKEEGLRSFDEVAANEEK